MVVTGSAAHIGRHLMDAVLQSYQVFAIADCSQAACGALIDPKITWLELDVADAEAIHSLQLRRIGRQAGRCRGLGQSSTRRIRREASTARQHRRGDLAAVPR
jgi:NAD(P)-dependent dehydrogenase (short-subunit alcohol dehydrogenase family)